MLRPRQKCSLTWWWKMTVSKPANRFWIALRQRIAPGWHTYWTNPGDTGAPLELTWATAEGFSTDPPRAPLPSAIKFGTLMSYGFKDEAVFLVRVTPPEALQPGAHAFQVEANYLVCEEICIPRERNCQTGL